MGAIGDWLNLLNLILFQICSRIPDSVQPPMVAEDMDVDQERERINKGGNTRDILCIKDLSKVQPFSDHPVTCFTENGNIENTMKLFHSKLNNVCNIYLSKVTYNHSFTDSIVNHARRQPARQEQSG